jgi:hypothetical protein
MLVAESIMLAADMNKIWLQFFLCSTKGVGQTAPNMVESKVADDGVVVPLGEPKQEPSKRVCTFPCCIYTVIYFQNANPIWELLFGCRVACFIMST